MRTAVAGVVGAAIGAALPARNGRERWAHALTGLAAGAAAGSLLSVGHGTLRYLSILRRPLRGKYPIAVLPRGTTLRGWIEQRLVAVNVLERYRIPPELFADHVITYDQIGTLKRPATWNAEMVLVGHSNGVTLQTATGRSATVRLRAAIEAAEPGQFSALFAPPDALGTDLRDLLRQFSGYRDIRHVDLFGCKCGYHLAGSLHAALSGDGLANSVRASEHNVSMGVSGIYSPNSLWERFAVGMREIYAIPVPGARPLPEDRLAAESPWKVWR